MAKKEEEERKIHALVALLHFFRFPFLPQHHTLILFTHRWR